MMPSSCDGGGSTFSLAHALTAAKVVWLLSRAAVIIC